MENKELTEIDRRLISTSRALLGASRSAVTQVSKGQFMIFDLFNNIWNYNKQLFKQLSEVRPKKLVAEKNSFQQLSFEASFITHNLFLILF